MTTLHPLLPGFLWREALSEDLAFLDSILLEAIVLPEDATVTHEEVWQDAGVRLYIEGWRRKKEWGLIAIDNTTQTPAGACWWRFWNEKKRGFGFVDEQTPELCIALFSPYRGKGLGTAMLRQLQTQAKEMGFGLSLSVESSNPALALYERLGFAKVAMLGTSWTMVWKGA